MFAKSTTVAMILLVSFATWIRADDRIVVTVGTHNEEKTTTMTVSDVSGVSGEVEVSDKEVDVNQLKKADRKRAVEENEIQEEVREELDRAVENLKQSAKEREEEEESNLLSRSNLKSCSPMDCNNRGTCLGTKKTYICACQLGFSGKNCEETVCDSARDCNGRGLCLGTTNQLTCLCNLGFSGKRCQTPV